MEWKKGIIQTDTNTSKTVVVVNSGGRDYFLTEDRFYPGLNKLKIGWEIYFQAKDKEITDVFMYGEPEVTEK